MKSHGTQWNQNYRKTIKSQRITAWRSEKWVKECLNKNIIFFYSTPFFCEAYTGTRVWEEKEIIYCFQIARTFFFFFGHIWKSSQPRDWIWTVAANYALCSFFPSFYLFIFLIIVFFFLVFLSFLGLHLWHMEDPKLGV